MLSINFQKRLIVAVARLARIESARAFLYLSSINFFRSGVSTRTTMISMRRRFSRMY